METKDLKVNGFLVKPSIGILHEILTHGTLDVNYQIYIPERLVLGNFKERNDSFIFSPGGIYYREKGEPAFIEYEEHFRSRKLDVGKILSVPSSDLEKLAQQARAYRTARQSITELITPLDKYF